MIYDREYFMSANFSVVFDSDGQTRIMDCKSGERMHPLLEPFAEAKKLYLEQSLVAIKRLTDIGTSPVVIWDVGLGAGANAMAFISYDWSTICDERLALNLVSFDITLEPLTLAFNHQSAFPYTSHPAVESILTNKHSRTWSCNQRAQKYHIEWRYVEGDFCQTWRESAQSKRFLLTPNVICFDPFSQPVMPSLWSPELIDNICDAFKETPVLLITYSISTAIRALFLSNGWYVAKGKSIGRRPECTLAVSPAGNAIGLLPSSSSSSAALLDKNWLAKFLRSDRPFPLELGSFAQEKRRSIVLQHQQFS